MITWQQIKYEVRDLPLTMRHIVRPFLQARKAGRDLKHEGGPARGAGDLVAVTPYYGNEPLLGAFLAHHRQLGVENYVVLDLSPDGKAASILAGEPNCAVWRPRVPGTRKAMLWLNYLRWRYGTGRWVLSLEPCEFLIFHKSETRKLRDLMEFVSGERRDHVFAIAIEMYGDRPAEQLSLAPGQRPVELLPYFDPTGYVTSEPGLFFHTTVRGGPQRRALYGARAPALNRVPLVKWRWFYNYAAGTRLLMPRRVNRPHAPWHTTPTACLLRFASLNDPATLHRAAEAESFELVKDGGGASYPVEARLRVMSLKTDISTRFTGSEDLVEAGLLNPGQWF